MGTRIRRWLVTLFSLSVLLPLGAVGMAEEPLRPESDHGMPVSRVVLFTSGVAYVEHTEIVTGDASRELTFPTEGMDDLLKSLVIRDLDGGRVGNVTYGAEEPLLRQLQKLPVDISDAPTVEELLRRIRGSQLLLIGEDEARRGALFGVEWRPTGSGEGRSLFVTILEEGALSSYPLDSLRSLQLEDKQLETDLNHALTLLANRTSDSQRRVTFNFRGEGERRVRIAYVREAPLWKLSYRLALEGADATLQGWAIVENTGSQPWENVQLSLVSGAPRSFVMELFAPQYVERPRLEPPSPGKRASQPQAPMAARRSEPYAEAEQAFDFAGTGPGSLTSGVEPAAEASERGEFVEYSVPLPVSMGPGEAAMLPVIEEKLSATRLSLFREGAGVHPRHAVEIENSTGLLLQAGAVTVFDDGSYGGDALLRNLPSGEPGTLLYAVDLETEVVTRSRTEPERITAVEARGGTLIVRRSLRRSATYELATSDPAGRTVRVEYPRETNWVLQSPSPSRTEAESYYFDIPVRPGTVQELTVEEERIVSQSVAISSLTEESIGFYLKQGHLLSPALQSGLEDLSEARQELAQIRRRQRSVEAETEAIFRAQERIRQNMEVLEKENRLYESYVERLEGQEEELDRLNQRRGELNEEEAAAERRVEQIIRSLSALRS